MQLYKHKYSNYTLIIVGINRRWREVVPIAVSCALTQVMIYFGFFVVTSDFLDSVRIQSKHSLLLILAFTGIGMTLIQSIISITRYFDIFLESFSIMRKEGVSMIHILRFATFESLIIGCISLLFTTLLVAFGCIIFTFHFPDNSEFLLHLLAFLGIPFTALIKIIVSNGKD